MKASNDILPEVDPSRMYQSLFETEHLPERKMLRDLLIRACTDARLGMEHREDREDFRLFLEMPDERDPYRPPPFSLKWVCDELDYDWRDMRRILLALRAEGPVVRWADCMTEMDEAELKRESEWLEREMKL